VHRLVHFETTSDVQSAIRREKEIKGWSRSRKIELIEARNTGWLDLAADWFEPE
jgi:putative endonuclease